MVPGDKFLRLDRGLVAYARSVTFP